MLEKDITPAILRSMRDDPQFGCCFVEVKVTKGETLAAGRIAEHQYRALMLASMSAVYFKIPDAGYQNPCDAVILKGNKGAEGWVVIVFESKKKPTLVRAAREVWAIPVSKIGSVRASITLSYARSVGSRVLLEP